MGARYIIKLEVIDTQANDALSDSYGTRSILYASEPIDLEPNVANARTYAEIVRSLSRKMLGL